MGSSSLRTPPQPLPGAPCYSYVRPAGEGRVPAQRFPSPAPEWIRSREVRERGAAAGGAGWFRLVENHSARRRAATGPAGASDGFVWEYVFSQAVASGCRLLRCRDGRRTDVLCAVYGRLGWVSRGRIRPPPGVWFSVGAGVRLSRRGPVALEAAWAQGGTPGMVAWPCACGARRAGALAHPSPSGG